MPWIDPEYVLTGDLVRLEPLTSEHVTALRDAVADGRLWEAWYTSVPEPDGVPDMVAQRLALRDQGLMAPFVTVRLADGVILGCTSFYDLAPSIPRVSIGYTWNRASAHGTGTNPESKLLLMRHAFEELCCRAVRYETSWSNQQSRAAIERLGARCDGVLRADKVERNGAVRDSVVYSLLAHEWPSARANLERRVARHLTEAAS